AADDHAGMPRVDRFELHHAVGEQDRIARSDPRRQLDVDDVAGLARDRMPQAKLGAAQVHQNRDMTVAGDPPDRPDRLAVLRVRAVREVQSEDVDAGVDERRDGLLAARRGTECGNDTGASHGADPSAMLAPVRRDTATASWP